MAGSYEDVGYPIGRIMTNEFLDWARKHYHVYYTSMFNAEAIAGYMVRRKEQKMPVPLTAILLKGIAKTLKEHPEARTLYYSPPKRLIRYEECNATIPVEREYEGQRLVFFANIRDCDQRSLKDLAHELERLRTARIEEVPEFGRWIFMAKLPRLVRRLAYLPMQHIPAVRANGYGTFGMTNIGASGVDDFMPLAASTVTFGVGALKERPIAEHGEVVARKTLALTLMFDHRAIDGYPAARFFQGVTKRLETPDFLD